MTDESDLDEIAQRIFDHLFGKTPGPSTQEKWKIFLQEVRGLSPAQEGRRAGIDRTIRGLTVNQRRLLGLHLSGLTYLEIARKQGKPSGEILQELSDAYAKIRLALL